MTSLSPRLFAALAIAALLAAPAARADDQSGLPETPPSTRGDGPAGEPPATTGAETPAVEGAPEAPAERVRPPPEPAAAPEATEVPATGGGKIDPISGVRLGPSGPRQDVHVVIRRSERAEGKQEFSLVLPAIQVNGKFTEHLGLGLDWSWHIREAFGVTAGATYYVRGVQSSFTDHELIEKAKQQPLAASALIQLWDARVGLELQPIYGKLSVFSWKVMQFGVFLGAGAGLTQTRIQLRPPDEKANRDRTYGDTGLRPEGLFNVGMRFFFGDHFAVKLELRDTIFSDAITEINGCSQADLQNIQNGNLSVGPSCKPEKFPQRDADSFIANGLLKEPSSDVLNNVAFVLGVAVLF